MIKFALITDIHYGNDKGWKLGSQAPMLMRSFVAAVNNYKPDFVVGLGDYVNSQDGPHDKKNLKKLKKHFNKINAPIYPILGNNEVRHITPKEYKAIMHSPTDSYVKTVNGFNFIFWNPNVNTDGDQGLSLKPDDIKWLEGALKNNNKPVIIFSHIPLDNSLYDDMIAKARDGSPNRTFYPQASQARKVIEDSGKVLICMAGHAHTNRHQYINGVHYLTNQSFTQSYNGKQALGAYYFVEIDHQELRIKGNGFKQPNLTINMGP